MLIHRKSSISAVFRRTSTGDLSSVTQLFALLPVIDGTDNGDHLAVEDLVVGAVVQTTEI